MKVILIKKFENHQVNDIIEVSDGYAKNYLIRNGIAQPVNKQTLANLKRVKANLATNLAEEIAKANKIKDQIEKLCLNFELKANKDVVHGSITHKAILKELQKHDIKLSNHALSGESFNTFGKHYVTVKLHPQVAAMLLIEIFEQK